MVVSEIEWQAEKCNTNSTVVSLVALVVAFLLMEVEKSACRCLVIDKAEEIILERKFTGLSIEDDDLPVIERI